MSRTVLVSPLIHPAAISRGMWHREPAQEVYLRRIKELGVRWEPPDVQQPPPNSILYPSIPQLKEFVDETRPPRWNFVSIDIENAGPHIICVGLTQVSLTEGSCRVGRSICLRFRLRGGILYWSKRSELLAAVQLLGTLLAAPTVGLVFHNGVTHDVPILMDLGFEVRGRFLDTMILHHTAYSEFPKGLGFCATFWLGSNNWKALVNVEDEDEGKG